MDTLSQITRFGDGARLKLRRSILVVEAGPDRGMELELRGRVVIVGRSPDAQLRLSDPTVSREHVRIEPEVDRYRVKDLGSKSGTRVNGVAVESAVLEPGLRVELGSTTLVLEVMDTEIAAPRTEGEEFEGMLGASAVMRELFGLVQRVAPLDLPVLLHGETGTGKEGLARALHNRGSTPNGPFVVVDCTLLSDLTHARSELFGHERGAFTGADKSREGAFVRADGGTLFLDEVGELPPELQAQLLRALQEGEIKALGSDGSRKVKVRVVCATHRNLPARVASGGFRQDLYYRLAAVVLEVPPLRDRIGDIEILAAKFLPKNLELEPAARERLARHSWPGNVRELQFVLARATALAKGGVVRVGDLGLDSASGLLMPPGGARTAPPPPAPVGGIAGTMNPEDVTASIDREILLRPRERIARMEEEAILEALRRAGGNRDEAAKLLGISRATLYRKLRSLKQPE